MGSRLSDDYIADFIFARHLLTSYKLLFVNIDLMLLIISTYSRNPHIFAICGLNIIIILEQFHFEVNAKEN